MERFNPLSSVMFSCLFKDMESKIAMLELLNAILLEVREEPVEEILDIKSEYSLIAEGVGMKFGRIDVIVRTKSGLIIDIEVQIAKDAITNRSIFYGAHIITDEFKSGEKYSEMPQVRCINILDFLVREDNNELVQPVSMMFEKAPTREATDIFKIYHIQMPVFRKNFKTLESVKDNAFHRWLYMFAKGYKNKEEMEMLAEMSEGLKNFAQKYNVAINDPNLVRLYRLEQDAIRDEKSRMGFAIKEAQKEARRVGMQEGLQKGHQEGLQKGLQKAALGMRLKGLKPEDISEITGLSVNEIMTL